MNCIYCGAPHPQEVEAILEWLWYDCPSGCDGVAGVRIDVRCATCGKTFYRRGIVEVSHAVQKLRERYPHLVRIVRPNDPFEFVVEAHEFETDRDGNIVFCGDEDVLIAQHTSSS